MVKKMKDDEIKNILNKLNNCKWEKDTAEITYIILFGGEVYKLLDYITNLQQENQELKKKNDSLGETNLRINGDLKVAKQDRIEYSNELEDYKSRCEKANEELINSKEYQTAIAMELNVKQSILIKLDNILNGRSDE